MYWENRGGEILSPFAGFPRQMENRPLQKYSFEHLKNRVFLGSEIKLEKEINDGNNKKNLYTSYLFTFETDGGKRVSGQANIPKDQRQKTEDGRKYPVIVMLRGYADEKTYFTGLGTRKAAGVFAENGFITLAPDFLGFGSSDQASADILEARFEKPVTALNLIASIKTLKQADPNKIFLWGHSNGGQIAISVLEINGQLIPTTLWAPVTRGFPESVLAYMGEMDDRGVKVKKAIEDFLNLYNSKEFSVDHYFAEIKSPLQLHQGLADTLVTEEWSDEFVGKMKSLGKEVKYYKYPKNDHNLSRDWETVVKRDLEFFRRFL